MSLKLGTTDIAGIGKFQTNAGWNIFDCKWADHTLNDVSWLRADTFSWQNGTTYSVAYNHLVTDISGITSETETIGSYTVTFYRATDGHKICLADQETTVNNIFSATGIAWYYILDTTNTRFKLPRTKWGFEGVRDNVGDYVSESLPNITGHFGYCGLVEYQSNNGPFTKGDIAAGGGFSTSGNQRAYWQFDASNSSSTYQNNAPVQERATQMYLYFYVGEYTQTAIEQTAGLNSELFNNKVDLNCSNISSTGQKVFDGQWINASLDLATSVSYTATGTDYSYSLANYLPNDGYNYEVLFSMIADTTTTNGSYVNAYLLTDIITNHVTICRARTRTTSTVQSGGNAILVVGTSRVVYVGNPTNGSGSFNLQARAYRRIGTNS